ncbi:24992_t:CDS:2, partial [Racocetra persica]
NIVDIGWRSGFPTFPKTKNMNFMIYVEGKSSFKALKGIDLPSEFLIAILITKEEYEIFEKHGMPRLLSHMGNAERYFPFPIWNDRSRKSVVTMNDLKSSILNMAVLTMRIPRISATLINKELIRLKIPSQSHAKLCEAISTLDSQYPLTILTDLDESADSCLVWNSVWKKHHAISSGFLSNLTGGCFITFCPKQSEDLCMISEDGFALLLKDNTYKILLQALRSRNSFNIKSNMLHFHLEFEWDSKIDGNGVKDIKVTECKLTNFVFLTRIQKLNERVNCKALVEYTDDLYNEISKHFSSIEKSDGFTLFVDSFITTCGSIDVKLGTLPKNYDSAKALFDLLLRNLMSVKPPIVYGHLGIRFEFIVWGGISEKDEEKSSTKELSQYQKIKECSNITRCFGVTRNLETGEYLLVVDYGGIDLTRLFDNARTFSIKITLKE